MSCPLRSGEVNERLWGDPYFRYERNHSEIEKMHHLIYSADIRCEAEKFSAIADSPINVERVRGLSSQKDVLILTISSGFRIICWESMETVCFFTFSGGAASFS